MKKLGFCLAVFLFAFSIAFSVFGTITGFRTRSIHHPTLAVIGGIILGGVAVVRFLAEVR